MASTPILLTDVFSKAIYSTWIFSKPLRTLFDAGEGLVSALRNRAFAIERVFITHGHYDHIGGNHYFNCRAYAHEPDLSYIKDANQEMTATDQF